MTKQEKELKALKKELDLLSEAFEKFAHDLMCPDHGLVTALAQDNPNIELEFPPNHNLSSNH